MKFMAAILRPSGMDGRLWGWYTSVIVSGQCLRERKECSFPSIVLNRYFDGFLQTRELCVGERDRSGISCSRG